MILASAGKLQRLQQGLKGGLGRLKGIKKSLKSTELVLSRLLKREVEGGRRSSRGGGVGGGGAPSICKFLTFITPFHKS